MAVKLRVQRWLAARRLVLGTAVCVLIVGIWQLHTAVILTGLGVRVEMDWKCNVYLSMEELTPEIASYIPRIFGLTQVSCSLRPSDAHLLNSFAHVPRLVISCAGDDKDVGGVTPEVVEALLKFDSLKRLWISGSLRRTAAPQLKLLRRLESLSLFRINIDASVLTEIINENPLRRLELYLPKHQGQIIDENRLEPTATVMHVSLIGMQVNDDALTALRRLSRLRSIRIALCWGYSPSSLAAFLDAAAIEQLTLAGSYNRYAQKNDGFQVDAIASGLSVHRIAIINCKLSDDGLLAMANNEKFRKLALLGSDVTSEGLKAFRDAAPWCEVVELDELDYDFDWGS